MERSQEGGTDLSQKLFKGYLKSFFEVLQQGDAREESFYPVLKDLLSDYAEETGRHKRSTRSAGIRSVTSG